MKKPVPLMDVVELKAYLSQIDDAIESATEDLQTEKKKVLARIKKLETTAENQYADDEALEACIKVLTNTPRPLNPVEAHKLLVAGGYKRNDKAGQGVIRDTLSKNANGVRSTMFIKTGRAYSMRNKSNKK